MSSSTRYMTKRQIEEMATSDVHQLVERDLNEIFEEMRQELSEEGRQPEEIEASLKKIRKPLYDKIFYTYKPHAEYILNKMAANYVKTPEKIEEEKSPSFGSNKK